ncbi:MAG: sialate O-acetylesterase [Bryobacteraceae bacterium]
MIIKRRLFLPFVVLLPPLIGADMVLFEPVPKRVYQRTGYQPRTAHADHPGGPTVGYADVTIRGDVAGYITGKVRARAAPRAIAFGKGTDWTEVPVKWDQRKFQGTIRVPAGGWYRLEVEVSNDAGLIAAGRIEPFGVGELFLTAGQSYAGNHNDERLTITDPEQRVVAFDWARQQWAVANDPQPNCTGQDGSIWPAVMNTLLPVIQVPIGLIHTAVGATAVEEWLPDQPPKRRDNQMFLLYLRLAVAGNASKPVRAVLWQQGESDVIANTTAEVYTERLQRIVDESAKDWGFRPSWLLAKSTHHPTVYRKPEQEAAIRSAIDQLWRKPGFRPGPDTDILTGSNRGGPSTRRHFSPEGQRNAGLLWFATIWRLLEESPAE